MKPARVAAVLVVALHAGCEATVPDAADLAGEISFDLGEPVDLPPAFGFDGNVLPRPDPAGTFVFSVTDETGVWIPSRVLFRPPPGSGFADSLTEPPPPPRDDRRPGGATGATVSPGVVGSTEGVLLQSGYGEVAVPPGDYRLFFTRGPEYEAAQVEVSVAAGARQAVNVELHRSVDTRGWLAADMHIHSALSFDAKVPLDRRAISMVSSGIEILVPTEHHGHFSFAELLPQLGYGPEVAGSVAGNELNFREGHAGVFPVVYDPAAPRGGSPPYQNLAPDGFCAPPIVGTNCLTAADAFALMRQLRPEGSLVTVNHPWFGSADLGYFTNIGWGAGTGGTFPQPLATAGAFDAVELLNGYWTRLDAISYILADWFYLLSLGHKVTALGNSDTHGMRYVRAGWPRSFLRMPIDRPGEITPDLLYQAIARQRVVVSTGPFLTMSVAEAQVGDTHSLAGAGEVRVRIVADAPSWIALDQVILFVDGQERRRVAVPAGRRPRLEIELTERIEHDSFLVALASGDEPMPADVVGEQAELDLEHTYPLAITNPIWLDADGDGVLRLQPISGPRLPWTPRRPASGAALQPAGYGAQGPAGTDCAPPTPTAAHPNQHPRLDAQSDLLRDALPLLYP